MKRIVLFLFILCLIYPASKVNSAETGADPLWQKAVAVAAQNQNWVPGTMMARVENLDEKGNLKSLEEESWTRYFLGQDGQIDVEIIKVIAKGKDVTEERRKELKELKAKTKNKEKDKEKEKSGTSMDLSDTNPFNPDIQSTVRVTPLNREEPVQEKQCLVYEYSWKKTEGTIFKGTAWLEKNSGSPAQIRYSPEPLPKHTTKLVTTIHYKYSADGACCPTVMVVEGGGSFLMIKKFLRITMYLSEFWKYHQES